MAGEVDAVAGGMAGAAQVVDPALLASGPYVMWGAIFIFNGAILRLLQLTLRDVDVKGAISEKAPTDTVTLVTQTTQQQPSDANGVTVQKTEETREVPQGSGAEASYSRLAGLVGAIVLACFIWGIGNVVIYKTFVAPADVKGMLDSLGGFFLAGASLFAPYAFNQLSGIFGSK